MVDEKGHPLTLNLPIFLNKLKAHGVLEEFTAEDSEVSAKSAVWPPNIDDGDCMNSKALPSTPCLLHASPSTLLKLVSVTDYEAVELSFEEGQILLANRENLSREFGILYVVK